MPSHITTSQLDRSDEGRALLGTWLYAILKRRRVAVRDVSKQCKEEGSCGGQIEVETGPTASEKAEQPGMY